MTTRDIILLLLPAVLQLLAAAADDLSSGSSSPSSSLRRRSLDEARRQLRTDSERIRLLVYTNAHLLKTQLSWTSKSFFAESPSDAAAADNLSALTRVRAAMNALFATGSSSSVQLDMRLEALCYENGFIVQELERRRRPGQRDVTAEADPVGATLDQAYAAALPALFQTNLALDADANALMTAIVAFLGRLSACDRPPRRAPPPSPLRVVNGVALVAKAHRNPETADRLGCLPQSLPIDTSPSSDMWPMLVAAALLLRPLDDDDDMRFDAARCRDLATALNALDTAPFPDHEWRVVIPPSLQIDVARRYLKRQGHRDDGGGLRRRLALVADELGAGPRAVLVQLVLMQGLYDDLGTGFTDVVLDGIVDGYLGGRQVPGTLRPYLVVVTMEAVRERRRLCLQEARTWARGRWNERAAVTYLTRMLEVALQLLLSEDVVVVVNGRGRRAQLAMTPDHVPSEPRSLNPIQCLLEAFGNQKPFTYDVVMDRLTLICPSLNPALSSSSSLSATTTV